MLLCNSQGKVRSGIVKVFVRGLNKVERQKIENVVNNMGMIIK